MGPDSRSATRVVLVATALAIDEDGRIPLVKNMGSWWLPGGRVEDGESFTAAAVREMTEETGLSFEPVGISHIAQERKTDRHVIFVTVRGTASGDLEAPVADPKISEVRWATPEEVDDLVPGYGRLWRGLLSAPTIAEVIESGG
jgi:ADP-ribose pyrophosphatase YjhB (NUDIX family)